MHVGKADLVEFAQKDGQTLMPFEVTLLEMASDPEPGVPRMLIAPVRSGKAWARSVRKAYEASLTETPTETPCESE